MITKALVLALSLTMTFIADTTILTDTVVPTYISVDIKFCNLSDGIGESICTIQESELGSRNKIFLDQNGNSPRIMIDRRDVMPEKADYLFQDNTINIGKKSVINVPYLKKSILILPGEYQVSQTRQGFIIDLKK